MNVFSIYSGITYTIDDNDFNLLDDGQIPLKQAFRKSCNKCYDRRYIGFNAEKVMYIPCSCVQKNTDSSRVHEKFNIDSSRV